MAEVSWSKEEAVVVIQALCRSRSRRFLRDCWMGVTLLSALLVLKLAADRNAAELLLLVAVVIGVAARACLNPTPTRDILIAPDESETYRVATVLYLE
jgi:alpha/beta superfamily hydrolase